MPGGALYLCNRCRLKFRHPVASAVTYDALYDNNATATWVTDGERGDWDRIVARIDDLKPRGGQVLDFGCYSGGLLSRLDGRYERFGIEVNQAAAGQARAACAATVWASLEQVPAGQRFDVVVLADVIEHLVDPGRAVEQFAPLLANDGIVLISTGDAGHWLWNLVGANWWYCFHPEHVAFISERWADRALADAGWRILGVDRFQYRRLRPGRRIAELVGAFAYGVAPGAYLAMIHMLRRLGGRTTPVVAPGCGALTDHILVALGRDVST